MAPILLRTRAEFDALVPDEAAARALIISIRWPDGVCCATCGGRKVTWLEARDLWQCNTCRAQTSVRSGTVMHRSKMPLRDWLFVAWRCSTVAGASILSIARELGRRYEPVFGMVHKLRAALAERGAWQIEHLFDVGTAWIRPTRKAKGDPAARPPVLTAVVLDPTGAAPDRIRLEVAAAPEQTAEELRAVAVERHVHRPAEPRWPVPVFPPSVADEFSRLRGWLIRRFGGVSRRYLANYLAQYAYTRNRWQGADRLFGWVVRRLIGEPWRPCSDPVLAP